MVSDQIKRGWILALIALSWAASLRAQQPEVSHIGTTADGINILEHIIRAGEQDATLISSLYEKEFNLYFDPNEITRRNGYKKNEMLGPVGVRIFLFTSKTIPDAIPKRFLQGQHIEIHEIKEGQTLFSIKTTHYPSGGAAMSQIEEWNDLANPNDIDIGMWLLMYKEGDLEQAKAQKKAEIKQAIAEQQAPSPQPDAAPKVKMVVLGHYNGMHIIEHTAELGSQNPEFIAELYNAMGITITSNQIRRWNGYRPGEIIEPGTRVFLFTRNDVPDAIPEEERYPSKRLITHLVDNNQSLASILRDYYGENTTVTVEDIIRWNDLVDENDIKTGQYLLLYINKRGITTTITDETAYAIDSMGMQIKVLGETTDGIKVIEHIVQANALTAETVYQQYIRLNISIKKNDILKRNGYSYNEKLDQGIRIFLFTSESIPNTIARAELPDGKKILIHEVVQGENLYKIWQRYYPNSKEVSMQTIVDWNDLYDENDIHIDQYIILYLDREELAEDKPLQAVILGKTTQEEYIIEHTAQQGVLNPETISKQYAQLGLDISGDDIRRWNGYKRGEEIADGTRIFLITKQKPPVAIKQVNRVPGKQIFLHNVNYSESLITIRNKYYPNKNVSLNDIVEWNDLTGSHDVNYEQKLILYR